MIESMSDGDLSDGELRCRVGVRESMSDREDQKA